MTNIKHYDFGRFKITRAEKMLVISYFVPKRNRDLIKSELKYTLGFDWNDGFSILFKGWK